MEYGNNPYAEMVHKKSITSTLIKCTNGMFALVQAFMFLSFKSIPGICTHVCKGFQTMTVETHCISEKFRTK